LDLGFVASTDWMTQSRAQNNFPVYASHGVNRIVVFKMISNLVDPAAGGSMDFYDWMFLIADANDMEVYPGMVQQLEVPERRAFLTDYVNAHKNMQGLAGWHQVDEPVDNVAYTNYLATYDVYHDNDPARDVFTIFTESIRWHDEWVEFGIDLPSGHNYAVWVGLPFWYSVVNAKEIAVQAARFGNPADFTLQCADRWPATPIPVPTYEENRYFAYGSLTVGCRGLYWWTLDASSNSTLQAVFYPVLDELSGFRPAYENEGATPGVTSTRDSNTTGFHVNGTEVNDVTYVTKTYADRTWILAVNNVDSTLPVTFTVDFGNLGASLVDTGAVQVLHESGRTVPLQTSGGMTQFTDTFTNYDAHAYELSWNVPPLASGAAPLSQAVAWWDMESLDDVAGANSALTVADAGDGTIAVGLADTNTWGSAGPGANGFYADLQSGPSRSGTYFDAGQGAGNELALDGAFTILWRGAIEDDSVTGYLWSKYDHVTGPNGSENLGAYLRYEPGGSLVFLVDDGVTTANNHVSLSLPAGTVTDDGTPYEIGAVFDPGQNSASLYVLNPTTRVVAARSFAAALFESADLSTPVPFTIGDRLTWNGSNWVSVEGGGSRVETESVMVWNQAFPQAALAGLSVGPPVTFAPITSVQTGAATMFEFMSDSNGSYRLEYSTTGVAGPWTWTGLDIFGSGGAMKAFDPAGVTTGRTYRILQN
jgi:hypothetical protein